MRGVVVYVCLSGGICTIDGRLGKREKEKEKFRQTLHLCMGGVNRYDMGTSTSMGNPCTGRLYIFTGRRGGKTQRCSLGNGDKENKSILAMYYSFY